jgi:tetratricopeptide (TPR) repeat protein
MMTRQIAICRNRGELVGETHGLLNLGYIQLQLGLYERASRSIQDSLKLAESLGSPRLRAYNHLHLCLAYWRLGNPGSALGQLEVARPLFQETKDAFGEAVSFSYQGHVRELEGRRGEAARLFEEARERLEKIEKPTYAADALAGLSRCALAAGELDLALDYTQDLWAFLRRHGAGGLEFPTLAYLSCARIFEACDQRDRLSEALEIGYDDLIRRAEKISDLDWRRAYLETVPEHQTFVEKCRRSIE